MHVPLAIFQADHSNSSFKSQSPLHPDQNLTCLFIYIFIIYSSFHLGPLSDGLAIVMHFDVHAHVHVRQYNPLAGFKHFYHNVLNT